MSGHARKIIINTFSNWGALLVSILVAFIMSPIIIRSLGDTNYGIWSLMTSISGYLTLLDLGIGSAVTRYVSKSVKTGEKKYVCQIFNSALALYVIIGCFIMLFSPLIGLGAAEIIKQKGVPNATLVHLAMVICADVALFLVGAAYRGFYQGVQRYDLVNAVTIGLTVLKAVVFFFLLRAGYGILALGYVIVFGDLLALAGYNWMVRFTNMTLEYSFKAIHREDVSTLISYSKFTFINMMANQMIYYSDSFVIGAFISAAAITYYSIGWSLVEYLKKFCVSFARVLVPVFSEMEASNSEDGMRHLMIAGGRASLYLSLPFCVALLLIGDQFISLWIGKSYADIAYPILAILLIPQFFEIPQQINCSLLFGVGKHRFLSYANTISGLVNLVMSILLAIRYGVIGVAIGTAVPQLVLNAVIIPWYVCRETGTRFLYYYVKVYANTLVSAAVFAVILQQLSSRFPANSYLTLFLNASIALLGYLVALYFTGLKLEEKRFVNGAIISVRKKFGVLVL